MNSMNQLQCLQPPLVERGAQTSNITENKVPDVSQSLVGLEIEIPTNNKILIIEDSPSKRRLIQRSGSSLDTCMISKTSNTSPLKMQDSPKKRYHQSIMNTPCFDNVPTKPQRESTLTRQERLELQVSVYNEMIGDDVADITPILPTRDGTLTKEERSELKNDLKKMSSVYIEDMTNHPCDKHLLRKSSICAEQESADDYVDDTTPVMPSRDRTLTKQERLELLRNTRESVAKMTKTIYEIKQDFRAKQHCCNLQGSFLLDDFAKDKKAKRSQQQQRHDLTKPLLDLFSNESDFVFTLPKMKKYDRQSTV